MRKEKILVCEGHPHTPGEGLCPSTHPATGERIELRSELHADLREFLESLRPG